MSPDDFPSGSAMEWFNNSIYILGDDARHMLIVDADYKVMFRISMFEGEGKRIPKLEKTDLETSTIINYKNSSYLLILGSASRKNREKLLLLSLPASPESKFEIFDICIFAGRIKEQFGEINIEGAAAIGSWLLISNRCNASNTRNLILVTSILFFENQEDADIRVLELQLPPNVDPVGISELCYSQSVDTLFFTASTELTSNAVDDGEIGDSYIGYISNISSKLESGPLIPAAFINLSESDPLFRGQKIEAICVEKIDGSNVTAHLVSDNDNGESTLFKISFSIQ